MKFMKPGKVAILTQGRYAGKKAVIIKNFDEGTKDRKYGHAIVVGIERYPRKITSKMGKSRVAKRARVKPFLKMINYNHLMPTRYTMELDSLKQTVSADVVKDKAQREKARKDIRKILEERFNAGKNKWFFTKLRF